MKTKLPRLKSGDAIEVQWVDAVSHENADWITEEDYTERDGGMPIVSVGIYIQKKDGCIKLCGERHTKEGYIARVARCFDIPLGCIKSIRKLI